MKISIKDLMRQACESLSGRWGLAIGTFFVYMLIFGGISGLETATDVGGFKIALNIIPLFIYGAFYLGISIFCLAIARNEEAEFGMLFSGFKNYGKTLGLFLLMMLLIVIGTLLLIVPGIILALMFGLAFFILADNPNIGVVDALKKSKAMMYGYKWKLFGLSLIFVVLILIFAIPFSVFFVMGIQAGFSVWFYLSTLLLVIASLWLSPFMYVTYAKFYDAVKANYVEEGR